MINIKSEIGKLKHVIVHLPGPEVENMTPLSAERALYSDILNLSVASQEYQEFYNLLKKFTTVHQVKELLSIVFENNEQKEAIVRKICLAQKNPGLLEDLLALSSARLTKLLIEGVPLKNDSLTNYMSKDRYAMQPLHNFFFTRDSSVSIFNKAFICSMANTVRERESFLMNAIFKYHPLFNDDIVSAENENQGNIAFEGGDIMIAREDIILIGIGKRTNSQGVDFIIDHLKKEGRTIHVVVQELPPTPESFIHLDMAFTLLDRDACMVYEPLIMHPNRLQTVYLKIDNGEVKDIKNVIHIPDILQKLGMDLKVIPCGGDSGTVTQEREQWHSGANFFALAPGKIIGYERNVYTADALHKNGFEVVSAREVNKGNINIDDDKKYLFTIPGAELARGGGGARCMTMPLVREE